jgi:riboflavin synthase
MFTGIIQALGRISEIAPGAVDTRLRIETGGLELGDVRLGDSITVNGVCLTAVELDGNGFAAEVSRETLGCTTLGSLCAGSPVNLEKSLTLATPLGGHLVSGHVDGLGTIAERVEEGRSLRFAVEYPKALGKYISRKGSIGVDGVSLTVNAVNDKTFQVQIIPHTLEKTIAHTYWPGTRVNLEVDIIARYLERLMTGGSGG